MVQKHYLDIGRLKEKYAKAFSIGEHVVIQTKIDGSNASFSYDCDKKTIAAFSRKTELNAVNNLRGFYEWTQRWSVEDIKRITRNGRYIVFGEWLVRHAVSYPDAMYNNFYMFDVWDCEIEQYLPYEQAREFYDELVEAAEAHNVMIGFGNNAIAIYFVPVLYDGAFLGWERTMELLSISTTGAQPCEEGIVIKSQDRLDNKSSNTPAYVKIVNERFSEVHDAKPKKPVDPAILAARAEAKERASTIITKRRVEKVLEKAVDNGELRVDWDEKDMGWIAKNVPKAIYEDCVKEENDIVVQCENFGKLCGSIVMEIVREMLKVR